MFRNKVTFGMKGDLKGDLISERGGEREGERGGEHGGERVNAGVNVGLSVYMNLVCKIGRAYRVHVISMSIVLQIWQHLRTLVHAHSITIYLFSEQHRARKL